MATFMQATADDLSIDLEIIYCNRDHITLAAEGMNVLKERASE